MKNIFGENLVSVRFCEDLSAVMPVYYEWQTAVTSVENVVENDKEKIGTNPCSVIGCCGFCFTTYEQAIETEGEKRKAFYETNVEELKNTQVAFVTLDNIRNVIECANSMLTTSGGQMEARLSPFLDDMYWENLYV
eukprot:UN23329